MASVPVACAADDPAPSSTVATTSSAVPATARAAPAPTTVVVSTPAPEPSPTPTLAPATETEGADVEIPSVPVPDGPRLGLDPLDPPADFDDDQTALRSILLALIDWNVGFDDIAPFVERPSTFAPRHEEFLAVLVELAADLVTEEPEIIVAGDAATVRFTVEGPAVGSIFYELEAERVDGRWVYTYETLCAAITISSIDCE